MNLWASEAVFIHFSEACMVAVTALEIRITDHKEKSLAAKFG